MSTGGDAIHTALRLAVVAAALAVFVPSALAQEDDEKDLGAKVEKLRAEGERLARRGNYDKALETLERIVRMTDSHDADLLYNLGVVAEAAKKCRQTVLYFSAFLYRSPGDPQEKAIQGKVARCLLGGKNAGTLAVDTSPSDVEIRVEGLVFGRAPLQDIKLLPGRYEVAARELDYHDYKAAVVIEAGAETKHAATLRKQIYKGDLLVTSEPTGARVWLDTLEVGKAPYERKGLDTRNYLIRVELEGWDRWVRYVTILRDQVVTVEATLEKTGMTVPIPPPPKN